MFIRGFIRNPTEFISFIDPAFDTQKIHSKMSISEMLLILETHIKPFDLLCVNRPVIDTKMERRRKRSPHSK